MSHRLLVLRFPFCSCIAYHYEVSADMPGLVVEYCSFVALTIAMIYKKRDWDGRGWKDGVLSLSVGDSVIRKAYSTGN